MHKKTINNLILLAVFSLILPGERRNSERPSRPDSVRFRPIAVELDDGEQRLLVAGERGRLAVIDISTKALLSSSKLGKNLSDLSRSTSDSEFWITDKKSHELIGIRLNKDNELEITERLDVCRYPHQVAVQNDGLVAVAGSWSRQISFVGPDKQSGRHQVLGTLDMEFVPGELTWLNGNQLLVVDQFGNNVAIIDAPKQPVTNHVIDKGSIVLKRKLPDRRVGGVSYANGQIAMATQMLNPLARSTHNDVHWGLMVSNDLELFSSDRFLSDDFNYSSDRQQQPIGGAGEARSDAERLVMTNSKLVVVAMGGASQLAIGTSDDFGFAYVFVGQRPVDLVIDEHEKFCCTANLLDGTISFVDLERLAVTDTIRLDEARDYTLEEQGERLFFDASVSHDGWMSCHSCHVNGHTNGLFNDNLSDDSFGTPKRVLSLLGHQRTEPMAWNGGSKSLEEQVRTSIEVTMQSDDKASDQSVKAIAAYINSLEAPPSLDSARDRLEETKITLGKQLFYRLDCASCHTPPTFTSPSSYEVGLEDEKGAAKFNPPSLIGLGQRDSFMHDGRAKSLHDVFAKIQHQIPNKLSDEEMSNLLAFLKSL